MSGCVIGLASGVSTGIVLCVGLLPPRDLRAGGLLPRVLRARLLAPLDLRIGLNRVEGMVGAVGSL